MLLSLVFAARVDYNWKRFAAEHGIKYVELEALEQLYTQLIDSGFDPKCMKIIEGKPNAEACKIIELPEAQRKTLDDIASSIFRIYSEMVCSTLSPADISTIMRKVNPYYASHITANIMRLKKRALDTGQEHRRILTEEYHRINVGKVFLAVLAFIFIYHFNVMLRCDAEIKKIKNACVNSILDPPIVDFDNTSVGNSLLDLPILETPELDADSECSALLQANKDMSGYSKNFGTYEKSLPEKKLEAMIFMFYMAGCFALLASTLITRERRVDRLRHGLPRK
eukprot:NODE_681_length_5254_cov_0.289040.p2 type:complete len:282 gc:universal NODE_681_length_5254_cov_0.289040:4918-4073(-)